MNQKEIGAFLKTLRREKGITQEQLAEILNVSGRTVSRWETGTNLPDLSILVKISEYYNVELKEILNGERKKETIDNELKETLLKVADYHELEKRRAAKTGSISFCIMFLVCAAAIVVQMFLSENLSLIVGETVIMAAGGLVYIFSSARNGSWNGIVKSMPKRDFAISIICSGIFSIILYLLLRGKSNSSSGIAMTAGFFVVISAVSSVLLRWISVSSQKKADKLNKNNPL